MDRPAPAARLLDLTRLVSRAGRVLTGVDRVERAYAVALAQEPVPLYGLVRTSLGFLLVSQPGVTAIVQAGDAGTWGTSDLLSRLSLKLDPQRQAGQSFARRHAIARCLPRGLGGMLARHLPPGTAYLNIGHSNLTAQTLAAVRHIPQSRITVMIHDTIPLDYPHYQRPGTVEGFAAKLRNASTADLILTPSEVSKGDIARHIGTTTPPIRATPLGVTPTIPAPDDLPPGLPPSGPYYMTVGTIEPRKNHALLLDVWEALGPDAPTLVICGGRGWNNAEVFARLDAKPANVIEAPGLSDGAIAALLSQSKGLLFPSHAEGFGLPLAEAAAQGAPVICSDLPICREVLGECAVYLPLTDRYLWQKTVMAEQPDTTTPKQVYVSPTWEEHFKTVLRMT